VRLGAAGATVLACGALACGRMPSPLTPLWDGSIGMPHRGVLAHGAELPSRGAGFVWLRHDDRHFALPRFAGAIERAAAAVDRQRPGSMLTVGDLSLRHGGQLLPHASHRNGRDADLLLYVMTLDGTPVQSPGFLAFGPDGLAFDEKNDRFLRFDVEREWLLLKALIEDPEARIQWMFVHHALEPMLIEWAHARGEPTDTILRAEVVMAQPGPPAQPHDDHVHVRTACTRLEMTTGCEPNGPTRDWLDPVGAGDEAATNAELVTELLRPIATALPVTDGD
jgi:penicillin-insensitive murein DD-endopeptidase